MSDKKTLQERYADDILTDNASLNPYRQCKDCYFRDRTTVNGDECGWEKGMCEMFEYPNFKPDDVMRNRSECIYYERDSK